MRVRLRSLGALLLAGLLAASGAEAVEELGGTIPPEQIEAAEALRKARRSSRDNQIRSRIARYIEAAGEKFQDNDYEEGMALVDRLKLDRLNDYERAQIYKLKAFMSYGTGDIQGAIDNFRKAIGEEILPIREEIDIRFNIAQLYAALFEWKEVIAALREWFPYVQEPEPLAYYLLAVAYYQLEEFEDSVHWAEVAVDATPEPKESWLQLLAALYVRDQDYAKAAPVFEELVMRFPKKDYWVQLSLIYGARDNYAESLAVQQIAYQQGLLTEDKELQRLARSYLFKNLPYSAAQVLEKGLGEERIEPDPQVYELLANAWIAAREYDKAIAPLTRAAELAEDGRLYVRLGQVNMQNEQWGEAARLIEKALAKGGFDEKQLASAQLLLGISYYNAEQVEPARTAFRQARRHESMREQADAWIAHLAKETQAG